MNPSAGTEKVGYGDSIEEENRGRTCARRRDGKQGGPEKNVEEHRENDEVVVPPQPVTTISEPYPKHTDGDGHPM